MVFGDYMPQYVVSYDIESILIHTINTIYVPEDSIDTDDFNDFGVAQVVEAIDKYFKYKKIRESFENFSPRNFQHPSYQDLKRQLQNFDFSTQERLQIIIDN